MGYHMLIFAQSDADVPVADLQECLDDNGIDAKFEVDAGKSDHWKQIELRHPNDHAISLIEKVTGKRAKSWLKSEIENLAEVEPATAARWLEDYLPRTKAIYDFQILSGTDIDDGWEAVWTTQEKIRLTLGGLLYAEGEGFSNEAGDQITWEFSDGVSGEWEMAVLDPATGEWIRFRMELGDTEHREAFRAGRVPDGLKTY